MLKRFKPAYWVYNLFKKSELKHNLPLYKKYGIKKSYYDSISSEDFKGIESPLNKYDEFDSAEHMANDPAFKKMKPAFQESLKKWSKDGYVILDRFYTEEKVAEINKEIDALIANKDVKFKYNGKKIMYSFHLSKLIHDAGIHPELMNTLSLLMGKKVALFSSINFIKGSEQRTHSDSIHMSTFPVGNLIAVWIALEDISEDQGPLHFYPGSHKLPYLMNSDFDNIGSTFFLGPKTNADYEDRIEELINKEQLQKKSFLAKKGDILIWHANLLHGGNGMNNKTLTRKSMVFHYYTTDAICYHEVSQRPSFKKQ